MSFASDDLAAVLVQHGQEFVGFGQGVLRSINPATGANTVEYRGTILRDLPVLPGLDSFGWVAGDIVLLMKWRPAGSRGAVSYLIAGAPLVPASGAGEKRVDALRSGLVSSIIGELVEQLLVSDEGQELAAFVLGQRVRTETEAAGESTTSTSFTDLATVGPTVEDVPVSASGKAQVTLSSILIGAGPSAQMSFTVSGATSLSASEQRMLSAGVTAGGLLTMTCSFVINLENLNEGLHTFEAKYRSSNGDTVSFGDRTISVIGF